LNHFTVPVAMMTSVVALGRAARRRGAMQLSAS
jgi:hypothetical protein